jgi:hypothetical protein
MQRVPFDVEAYVRRVRASPCFICEVVAGPGNDGWHEVIAETEDNIAFLGKYPPCWVMCWSLRKPTMSMWWAISVRLRTSG